MDRIIIWSQCDSVVRRYDEKILLISWRCYLPVVAVRDHTNLSYICCRCQAGELP